MRRAFARALVTVLAAACVPVLAFASPAYAAKCDPESRSTPMPQQPWPLARLHPEKVWPLTRGKGVKVAVIDSGVGKHPVLKGQVTAYDYTKDGRGARCDMASHGTLVAGIIAGRDSPDQPFHGLAPDAHILSYRVIDTVESSDSRDASVPVVKAIRDAADAGAGVINLSLTAANTKALKAAIAYAHKKDVVIVAAAGNSGVKGTKEYPAAYPHVIAVAGIGPSGKHVESSSVGTDVDVAAPGEQIDGPAPAGGGYGRRAEGGTSFAAPYVSATAALLRSYYPSDSADDIARRITLTADHPAGGWNSEVGYGELNPRSAVTTVLAKAKHRAAAAPEAPVPPGDPGAATRAKALWWVGGCVGLVLLLLAAKLVVPRGRARRWRCP